MKWHTKCWLVLLVLVLLCASCGNGETPVVETPTREMPAEKAPAAKWELTETLWLEVDLSGEEGEENQSILVEDGFVLDTPTTRVKVILEFIPDKNNSCENYIVLCRVGRLGEKPFLQIMLGPSTLCMSSSADVSKELMFGIRLGALSAGVKPPQRLSGTIVAKVYQWVIE